MECTRVQQESCVDYFYNFTEYFLFTVGLHLLLIASNKVTYVQTPKKVDTHQTYSIYVYYFHCV